MKIHFHGQHSTEEAAETLLSVLKLFQERYGISDFRELELDMVLMNLDGDDVELIDASTLDVLEDFEVYKTDRDMESHSTKAHLELVVDNTKK